jgi:hypothetical protein
MSRKKIAKTPASAETTSRRAKHLPPTPSPSPASGDLTLRARRAVENAYEAATDDTPRPLFSEEMMAVARNNASAYDEDDPLCLFRYFHLRSNAEWYVMTATRLGKGAVNMFTGESAEGHVEFYGFACLGVPQDAECGTIPLDKASGMGLRDLPGLAPGVASVELDRHWTPQRLSVVRRRVSGK